MVADYGFENVGCELKVGNNKIDICVKKNEYFDIYEIKTCSSARACVREAMGQILEYAFFKTKESISKMYIVSDCAPDSDVEEYLLKIRNLHHIPIYYLMQVIGDKG